MPAAVLAIRAGGVAFTVMAVKDQTYVPSANAPIARISADYPRDFSGQRKAVSDARAQALPPVQVEPIDLAPGRRVFLVSPTWMFRPATPLWTYVEQAALTGKQVVLVTTGNSRFDPPARTDNHAERGPWSEPQIVRPKTQVRVSASQNAHAMTF
jgi:hypothetical protein